MHIGHQPSKSSKFIPLNCHDTSTFNKQEQASVIQEKWSREDKQQEHQKRGPFYEVFKDPKFSTSQGISNPTLYFTLQI